MSNNTCSNCNRRIDPLQGKFKLDPIKTVIINRFLDRTALGYCTECAKPLIGQLSYLLASQRNHIEKRLRELIDCIPVISSPAHRDWNYQIRKLVSAQRSSGTGIATELSRTVNDFLGTTSNSTNTKIADATEQCMLDLQVQCLRLGGNAVISANTSYSEIGSGSTNMLLVCMTGTAIQVEYSPDFFPELSDRIAEAAELYAQLELIR